MLGKQGISRTRRRFRGVAIAMHRAMRSVPQIYDEALVPCGLRSTQRSVLIASRERGGRRWVNSPRLLCSIVQHWLTTSNRSNEKGWSKWSRMSTTRATLGCADRGRLGEARPVAASLGRRPTPFRARVRRGEGESVASNVRLHRLAGVRPSARLQIIVAVAMFMDLGSEGFGPGSPAASTPIE